MSETLIALLLPIAAHSLPFQTPYTDLSRVRRPVRRAEPTSLERPSVGVALAREAAVGSVHAGRPSSGTSSGCRRPCGAAAGAIEQSLRHRHRAEPPGRRACEQSRLEGCHEGSEFFSLVLAQRARPTPRLSEECEKPATLNAVELGEVCTCHRDYLGGQQDSDDRNATGKPFDRRCFEQEPEHEPIVALAVLPARR